MADFSRSGSNTVTLTGTLNNTTSTVTLGSSTAGAWTVSGGRINGGTIAGSGGASLDFTTGGTASGTLDGVTLGAGAKIESSQIVTVLNGLTLNGTATVVGTLRFGGSGSTQSLGGTGSVVLSGGSVQVSNTSTATTLTVGSGILIHGHGSINQAGSSPVHTLVNTGTIKADDSGGTLTISIPTTNDGTLAAINIGTLASTASTLTVNASTWTNASDGTVSISGTKAALSVPSASTLTNSGLIDASSGGVVTISSTTFNNLNTVKVRGGATATIQGVSVACTVIPLSSSGIETEWQQVTPASGSVQINRSRNGGSFLSLGNLSAPTSTYFDQNLDGSSTYVYQTISTNASGGQVICETASTAPNSDPDRSGWYLLGIKNSSGSALSTYTNSITHQVWNAPADPYADSPRAALEEMLAGLVSPEEILNAPIDGSTIHIWHHVDPGGVDEGAFDLWAFESEQFGLFDSVTEYTIDLSMVLGVPPEGSGDPNASGGDPAKNGLSDDPIQYFDGSVDYQTTDLSSDGLGSEFGQKRYWTNTTQLQSNSNNGTGWIDSNLPYLLREDGGNRLYFVRSPVDVVEFDNVSGTYVSNSIAPMQLTHDATNSQFVVTDSLGNTFDFYDFTSTYPTAQQGQFKSSVDAGGNVAIAYSHSTDGDITEVRRKDSSGADVESWAYTYLGSGDPNAGLLSNVQLRRPDGSGGWTVVRQVQYSYYDGTDSFGSKGDLKTAAIEDGASTPNVIDTDYYRYYTADEAGGYPHAIKYIFDAASFARLAAAYTDPFTATDTQVAPFAVHHYEYDSERRVTEHDVQGSGGSTSSGIGAYTYEYSSSTNTDGTNSWKYKTIEMLPDGNQNIVYCNSSGEVMLKVFSDIADPTNSSLNGQKWGTFYEYDSQGRIILEAEPSAVDMTHSLATYEAYSDLLHSVSGNYAYLSDSSGLIHTHTYYATTGFPSGGAPGYLEQDNLRQGETSSDVPQQTLTYSNISGTTVYLVASDTVYTNTNGTGGLTTTYSYTPYSGTAQVKQMTVTYPGVSTAQNGPGTGSPDSETVVYDVYGRPIWTQDGSGYLTYTQYDLGTGAITESILDADPSAISGAPVTAPTRPGTLPTAVPLTTSMAVDGLGRTTELTDPNSNVTYFTYDDPDHEIRTYRGWNSTTHLPTGPTIVLRQDRADSYTESLTMSATPHLTGGVPDGQEAIGDVQSLQRIYTNAANQIVTADRYFDLAGLTYSAAANLGTLNTNYYRTTYAYDVNGVANRVEDALGTITITLRDALGRTAAIYVGTNDSTTDGHPWTPANAGSSSNMTLVQDFEYDGNDVGDSNLTRTTAHPDSSSSHDRVTANLYDWRDRLILTKSGVQTTEATTVNRPLTVLTLNNLGEVLTSSQYDADGLSMADTDADGIPDALGSASPVSEIDFDYDNRGRVFQTTAAVIDQQSGAVGTPLVTNDWYDARGNIIKVQSPSGLVTKNQFDGAGRLTATYSTDGGGDSVYGDASNVTGDVVLQETHYNYDSDSNLILTTSKLRFGDESSSATGALGDSSTSPKARVTYSASYYDAANRKVADVNVGTNGGSTYTRPSSVPSRSDTDLVNSYEYDSAGHLQSLTDPRGITSKTFYDALGRVTSTVADYTDGTPTDSSNQTVAYTYDGLDHVLTKTNVMPTGTVSQQTQYVYGVTTTGSALFSNDLLSEVDYPDATTGEATTDNRVTYGYDALGEVTGSTDQLGAVHEYSYNVLGQRTNASVTTSDGSGNPSTQFTFDTLGNIASITDPNSNTTSYDYDSLGRRLSITQPSPDGVSSQPVTNYGYDAAGNLTSVTDANGNATSYTYDLLGRRLSQTQADPDGAGPLTAPVTTYAYNVGGDTNTTTDPLGNLSGATPSLHTTQTALDQFGRTASVTGPSPDGIVANPTTTYEYDRDGNLLSITDPLSNATTFEYDNLNRKTSQTLPDPDGAGPLAAPVTTYGYDAQGNVVSMTDPLSRETTYTYDALNRRTSETLPDPDGAGPLDASVTQYGYDVAGNLTSVTDPLENVTAYEYNQLGRKVSQTLPDPDGAGSLTSPVTSYEYDLNGNLTSLTDPVGNVTTYEYDNLNRETSESATTADGTVTRSWTYDPVGNVLTTTDRDGRVRQFTYDNLNRQLTEEWLDSSSDPIHTITSTYDAKGRLTSISDENSSYTYTYDNLDRLLTSDNAGTPDVPNVVLTSAYDADGQRTSVSATVDSTADFTNGVTFDSLGRVTGIEQSGTGIAEKRVDYVYRPDGAYDSITRYSDLAGTSEVATTAYTYDDAGRLTDLAHTNGSTTLADYSWTYDSNGRITGFTSPDGTTTYTYDTNGQLTAADNTGTAPDESYSYDENGNRTNSGYTTDADNRLTSDGTYDYEYDAEGNRIKQTTIATGDYVQYAYDYRNRLTDVTFRNSSDTITKQVRYTYDALNRRIGKEIDANGDGIYESAERYVYDGDNIVLVFDGSGALLQRYLHGPGTDDVVAEEDASGNVNWMLSDEQGSVRDVIDSSGTNLDHIVYDSFGNVVSRTGTTTLRYGYVGRELDQETGLYFDRARYYDPHTGDFISEDPKGFGAGDSNLYRYVGNSTPNFTDPSGMDKDQNAPSVQPPPGKVWLRNPFSSDPNAGSWVDNPDAMAQQQAAALNAVSDYAAAVHQMQEMLAGIPHSGGWTPDIYQPQEHPFWVDFIGMGDWDDATHRLDFYQPQIEKAVADGLISKSDGQQMLKVLAADVFRAAFHATVTAGAWWQLGAGAAGAVAVPSEPVPPGVPEVIQPAAPEPVMPAAPEPPVPSVPEPPTPSAPEPAAPEVPAVENALPTNESQLGHIFRDAEGHLPNTPENQQLLQDVANDSDGVLGTDQFGNTWSAKTLPDGTQVWTQTRNGQIINGGLNQTPRTFNPLTGLSAPAKPGG